MRFRVLLPLFLVGVVAVIAILIPVGASIADSRTQQLQLQRAESMQQILQRAHLAIDQRDSGELQAYLTRFADTYGEAVLVVDGGGAVVASVGDIEPTGAAAQAISGALRGVPQWSLSPTTPWSPDTAIVADPLTLDGRTPEGAVALRIDQTRAKLDVAAGWAAISATGVALLLAVLLASLSWTRWVIRPVLALDTAANALAENRRFSLDGASGPPELRRLSRSFERMAGSVEEALDQQRGLVADASHQLRNPLAAVRLRIDSLRAEIGTAVDERAVDPEAQAEIAAIESDLDRLEHTVARMLALANAEHRATAALSGHGAAAQTASPDGDASEALLSVSADELIAPHCPALEAAGITVVASAERHWLRFRPGDLAEAIEIIADNARKYAAGTTVRVELSGGADARADGGDAGADAGADATTLTFSDSGAGLLPAEIAQIGTRFWRAPAHARLPGSGLGYAIIAQLVRANDAQLRVDRAPEGGLRTTITARSR